MKSFIIGALSAFLLSTTALAVDCDSIVVDDAHIFHDVSQVEAQAKKLASNGATVRIRTFDTSVKRETLDKAVDNLRQQCPTWQSPDGKGWKSTMLVQAFAPEGKQHGVYYGSALQSRIGDGKWSNTLKTLLIPLQIAYYAGEKDGMTRGFVSGLQGMQGLLSVSPGSHTGPVTIHNETKVDYSHVWLWFFILLGLGGAGVLGFWWWHFENNRKAAQREAKRCRALVVSGLNEISGSVTHDVLQVTVDSETDENRKTKLQDMLTMFDKHVNNASDTLSQFDNFEGNDPNNSRLSVDAYKTNQRMYMDILHGNINPARNLKKDIEEKNIRSSNTPSVSTSQHWGSTNALSSRSYSNTDYVAPKTSKKKNKTVVEHHHHYDSPTYVPTPPVVIVEPPVYIPPPVVVREERSSWSSSSSRDNDDSSSSWSRSSSSSDSGGSWSSDSSSSSYDSSSSDSGGSFSSGD